MVGEREAERKLEESKKKLAEAKRKLNEKRKRDSEAKQKRIEHKRKQDKNRQEDDEREEEIRKATVAENLDKLKTRQKEKTNKNRPQRIPKYNFKLFQ